MTVTRDDAPRKPVTASERRVVTASPSVRLAELLDDGSVELMPAPDGCGMLAATGTVDGTPVVAFATDPTVQGGAMSGEGCRALVAAYARALEAGCPIVGICPPGGARLTEGVASLDGVGRVFTAMTRASGRVPQISLVLGPAAGG